MMMETEAEKIHGIRLADLSDSSWRETDSGSASVFDEVYNAHKPPPIPIHNIIIGSHPIIYGRNRNMFPSTSIKQYLVPDVSKSIPPTNIKKSTKLKKKSSKMIANIKNPQTIPKQPITDYHKQKSSAENVKSSSIIDIKSSKIHLQRIKPNTDESIDYHALSQQPQEDQALHQELPGNSLSKPLTKPLLPKATSNHNFRGYKIKDTPALHVSSKEYSSKNNGLVPIVQPQSASAIFQNTSLKDSISVKNYIDQQKGEVINISSEVVAIAPMREPEVEKCSSSMYTTRRITSSKSGVSMNKEYLDSEINQVHPIDETQNCCTVKPIVINTGRKLTYNFKIKEDTLQNIHQDKFWMEPWVPKSSQRVPNKYQNPIINPLCSNGVLEGNTSMASVLLVAEMKNTIILTKSGVAYLIKMYNSMTAASPKKNLSSKC